MNRRSLPKSLAVPVDRIKGLTLMELLISMALTGIIMLSVYGSFRMITGAQASMGPLLERYSQVAFCLDRISTDLQNMIVDTEYGRRGKEPNTETADPSGIRLTEKIDFTSTFPVFSFLSSAFLPLQPAFHPEPVRITYYVDTATGSKPVLRRLQQGYPYDPIELSGKDPILCETIREVQWRFIDETGQVHDSWNPDSTEWKEMSPAAIDLRLVQDSIEGFPPVTGRIRIQIPRASSSRKPASPSIKPDFLPLRP